MKPLLLGSLLSAIAMYVLGAVFWMSPLPYQFVKNSPDDAAAQAALRQHFPESGTYFVPGMGAPEETVNALHEAGPIATVFINQQGCPMMNPKVMIAGFLHMLVTSLLLGCVLRRVTCSLPCYWCRVLFLTGLGFVVGFVARVGFSIWWLAPIDFPLVQMVFDVLSFFVAGLVLAGFIRCGGSCQASGSGELGCGCSSGDPAQPTEGGKKGCCGG